uniref:Uncharacterized protein n=1 Tax=Knipowitschia caucasica TaxID=637954 RepID=A0AAV2MA81_KNICA
MDGVEGVEGAAVVVEVVERERESSRRGCGPPLQPVQRDGDRWRPSVGHGESQFSPAGPMGKIRLPHTCKPCKRPWNGMLLLLTALRRDERCGVEGGVWWGGGWRVGVLGEGWTAVTESPRSRSREQ